MEKVKVCINNITSEEKMHKDGLCLIKLICNVDYNNECHQNQVSLIVTPDEYISIKNNGYYYL